MHIICKVFCQSFCTGSVGQSSIVTKGQKAAFMCATFCLTCRGAVASVCCLFQDGPHATPTSALKDEAACARLFRWHSGRCKVSNSTASGPEAPCIVSLPCVYCTMAPPKIINSHIYWSSDILILFNSVRLLLQPCLPSMHANKGWVRCHPDSCSHAHQILRCTVVVFRNATDSVSQALTLTADCSRETYHLHLSRLLHSQSEAGT